MVAARATTEVEAANLGLTLLREPEITTLADANARARAVNKWFGTARDELLREHFWNFAKAWDAPAANATDAIGPLKKRYVLPADAVAVREVLDKLSELPLAADQWAVEHGMITIGGAEIEQLIVVTNNTGPLIGYTRRVTNVAVWDTQFVSAFALRLARYVAPAVGKSAADIQGLEVNAELRIDDAARRDAREQAPKTVSRNTSWVQARTAWPSPR